jgi:hypothetical protein
MKEQWEIWGSHGGGNYIILLGVGGPVESSVDGNVSEKQSSTSQGFFSHYREETILPEMLVYNQNTEPRNNQV